MLDPFLIVDLVAHLGTNPELKEGCIQYLEDNMPTDLDDPNVNTEGIKQIRKILDNRQVNPIDLARCYLMFIFQSAMFDVEKRASQIRDELKNQLGDDSDE